MFFDDLCTHLVVKDCMSLLKLLFLLRFLCFSIFSTCVKTPNAINMSKIFAKHKSEISKKVFKKTRAFLTKKIIRTTPGKKNFFLGADKKNKKNNEN